MTLAAARKYVEAQTGVKRSRQTMYNWAANGVSVGGEKVKLQTEMKAGQVFTRAEWVDAFLARINGR